MLLRGLLCGLSVLASLAPGFSLAQDRDVRGGGIDLVLLVDVSRSNWEFEAAKRNGSDPDRVRWDAVKLVLDLLSPSDRVMVQRFNNESPPTVINPGTDDASRDAAQKKKTYLDALEQYKFFKPDDEFEGRLQFLTKANREKLQRKAFVFNRRDDAFPNVDQEGVMDFAGTKIVQALQVVGRRLKTQPVGRQTHVILLTDGLDEDFDEKNYGSESVLRRSLSFFSNEDRRIPIHTLGLNLKAEGKEGAIKARTLLRSISHITGGEFKEAATSEQLIPFFLEFMRKLKGYWLEDLVYQPGGEQTVVTPRMVVNGIIDLGIMSYEVISGQADKKYSTDPPQKPVSLEWLGLREHNYDAPSKQAPRSGKPSARSDGGAVRDSIYHFFYFGPPAIGGELGRSPFAQYENPVTLQMQVNKSSDTQHLVLLKGTAELFRLISPAPEAAFQRTQSMAVRVAMTDSQHFKPESFQVFAKIARLGHMDDPGAAKQFELQPESAPPGNQNAAGDHETDFVVRVPLTELPFEGPDKELYEVAVWIEGKSKPDIQQNHALSGNRRDLSSRSFVVENKLVLNPIANVELTQDKLVAMIPVSTSLSDVVDKLELGFQFLPPTRMVNGKPERLADSLFKVQPANGKLVLQNGKGVIRIELPADKVPEQGIPYAPGRVVLSAPVGIPMTPANPSATVSLRLNLSKVLLTGVPTLLVNPQQSEAMKVSLAPNEPELGDVDLTVTLEPVEPNRPGAKFTAEELWVFKQGEAVKSQTIKTKLGEPFFVKVQAANKLAGKYKYRIRIESDRIDPVSAEFSMDIEAPRIVTDRKEATVHLSAGKTARFELNAWITNALPGRTEKIYVKDAVSGQRVSFFQDNDTGGRQMAVRCSDQLTPVELQNVVAPTDRAAKQKMLTFSVDIPADIPYGHYWRDFDLVGNDVVSERFRINIIVDGLEVDFLGKDTETGEDKFEKKSSEQFIYSYHKPTVRKLRVRTGRALPLKENDLRVAIVGPFRDDGGDVQELPTVSSQLINESRELLITVRFPAVTNANGRGYPYRIKVVAESRKSTLVTPDVEFRFDVRILDRREIVPPSANAPTAD
jgi:hypothetical protein